MGCRPYHHTHWLQVPATSHGQTPAQGLSAHPAKSRPRSSELGTEHSKVLRSQQAAALQCHMRSGPLPGGGLEVLSALKLCAACAVSNHIRHRLEQKQLCCGVHSLLRAV
jgi:hypothetical protein